MLTKQPDDCPHFVCTGKRGGPHHERCPSTLMLSDGDVLAFSLKYITLKGCILVGNYRGHRATASFEPRELNGAPSCAERWLAEELIMFERNGGKR